MNKVAVVVFFTLFWLVVSSVFTRYGAQLFECYTGSPSKEKTMQREEHGFPLVFVKRSVSPSLCSPINVVESNRNVPVDFGNDLASSTVKPLYLTNPDQRHEQYGNSYIIVINLLMNIAFWATWSYAIITIYEKIRKQGGKHGA